MDIQKIVDDAVRKALEAQAIVHRAEMQAQAASHRAEMQAQAASHRAEMQSLRYDLFMRERGMLINAKHSCKFAL